MELSVEGPVIGWRRRLVGGVVSRGDGPRLAVAVDSLLEQKLPDGAVWAELRVVVGEDDTSTLTVARACAASDPRVRLLLEPGRRGKSAAIRDVLAAPGADYFILLNGDARADPGAVAALLGAVERSPAEAVTARPIPERAQLTIYGTALGILWEVHDAYHAVALPSGGSPHLSDELLLLSAAGRPTVPAGVVNDGAYLAMAIDRSGGRLGYAPEATVRVATPATIVEHFHQRRRILWGHYQVGEIFGRNPGTFTGYALRHPGWAVRLLWKEARQHPRGFRALGVVIVGEILAHAAALWDSATRHTGHVHWRRVQTA